MMLPCDGQGCGTVMRVNYDPVTAQVPVNPVRVSEGERPEGYTRIENIPYENMQNVVQHDMNENLAVQPVPGTSNLPTFTGVEATQPVPGSNAGISAPGNVGVAAGSLPTQEEAFANAPTFTVPRNPLLPPEYQEVLNYSNLQYLNGFLRTQIGKYVRIQQLIGSNVIEDRYGYLVGVGINYLLLQEISTGNILALDFWNIKYVYVYYTQPGLPTNG